jgi:hypothetical protein
MMISTSVILLQPGMYILRHPGAGMPALSVATTPNSTGKIDTLIADPGHGMTLKDNTDCIVMRVGDAPAELLIAAFSADAADAAITPTIKIDRIALLPLPDQIASPVIGSAARQNAFSILGHVERQGDVVVQDGELLGNPAANLRLEGIQVIWADKPEGVDLAYGVLVEGGAAVQVERTGGFTGTRREGRRIVEATFALIGPNASNYGLEGNAYFSGGFQLPVKSGVPLAGPSGLEHLSGLTLRVVTRANIASPNLWDESVRTRVFKADIPAPADAEKAGKFNNAVQEKHEIAA